MPDAPGLPLDGGGALSFGRTYNLKNARLERVRWPDENGSRVWRDHLYGRSWVGLGWTGHLGRIFRAPRYAEQVDGAFSYSDKSVVRDFYEFPSGTLYRFFPSVKLAHPSLKIEYFVDCTGATEPDPPECCGSANKPWCDPDSPKCTPTNDCTNRPENDPAKYVITDPAGIKYTLEQLVAPVTVGAGYVDNADRAGFYVVRIVDRHGNKIKVSYHNRECKLEGRTDCDAVYPYPEAIHSITRENGDQRVRIDFTVWAAGPGVPNEVVGMLKDIVVPGTANKNVRTRLSYVVLPVAAGVGPGSWNVPVLEKVSQLAADEAEVAVTRYFYGPTGGAADARYTATIASVQAPTGAVTEFGYSWSDVGKRAGETTPRKVFGVGASTVHPEGVGTPSSPKPSATWTWSRQPDLSRVCDAEGYWYLDNFRLTQPDGRYASSVFYGHPCGKADQDWGPFGAVKNTAFFAEDGSRPIRSVANQFDYSHDNDEIRGVLRSRTIVTYHDDNGNKFDEIEPAWCTTGCPQMTTTNSVRDSWGRWRATKISGSYLPRSRRVSTTYHPGGSCDEAHVLGPWLYRTVQDEGGERIQEDATFDGCDGMTSLTRLAQVAPYVDADVPSRLTGQASDPTVHFEYDGSDNLIRQWTSGPETYPDNTPATLGETTYASANGVVTRATVRDRRANVGLWNAVERTVAPNGLVETTLDPNGLQTAMSYDEFNRPTTVDPPGTVEAATAIAYPDLRTVTTSVGSGTAELLEQRITDGLGRVVEERRRQPGGSMEKRVRRYDGFGREVFVSEWHQSASGTTTWQAGSYFVADVPTKDGAPLGTIVYFGIPNPADPLNPLAITPDPLGRVRSIRRADGSTTDISYRGPHERVTVHGVQTSLAGGTSDAETTRYFDGLGRLVIVDAPPGTANAVYAYNARDQLVESRLLTDAELTADPFGQWKSPQGFPAGQKRLFEYDGAGRLLKRTTPEEGTIVFGVLNGSSVTPAYDPAGNVLVWTDEQARARVVHYRNEYDAAGRLTKVRRVTGTPVVTAPPMEWVDLLAGGGSFESGLGSWQSGTLDGSGRFIAGSTQWNVRSYAQTGCVPALTGGGNWMLHWGTGCGYPPGSGTAEVLRRRVNGVGRDDVLTLAFWRQLRENAPGKDAFGVYVVAAGSDDADMSQRRTVLYLDGRHDSFARWQRPVSVRPGDLYQDWSTGSRDLWILLVFDKGDTANPGTGAGLYVDDLRLGYVDGETLVEQGYDESLCGDALAMPQACEDSPESVDRAKGRPTRIDGYVDGRLATRQYLIYRGLNGRLSAQEQWVDWTQTAAGDSPAEWNRFLSRFSYTALGEVERLTVPYLPGVEAPRRYQYGYAHGALDWIKDPDMADEYFVRPGGIAYGTGSSVSSVLFANGASTTIGRDVFGRTASITAQGFRAGSTSLESLWASGAYGFDGAGNIAAIGAQAFAYTPYGALAEAKVLPQAKHPSETIPDHLQWTLDTYGNVTTQDWLSGPTSPAAPADLEFDASIDDQRNRRADQSYDENGSVTRTTGLGDMPMALLWRPGGLLSTLIGGDVTLPEARPVDQYLYDAGGLRLVRYRFRVDAERGRPLITLRGPNAQVLSQYEVRPGAALPQHERDFVYGRGLLLVERKPVSDPRTLTPDSPLAGQADFGLSVGAGAPAGPYTVDIRTAGGYTNVVTGLTPDAAGRLRIPESALAPGVPNALRIKAEGANESDWSAPMTLSVNVGLASSAPNQVRTIAVGRNGSNIVIRWSLLQANGKGFRVYFRRADTGTLALLTPQGLAAGTMSLSVPSQSLGSPCGSVFIRQWTPPMLETEDSIGTDMPGPASGPPRPGEGPCPGGGGGTPGSGPERPMLAESYHHRDHLGSLRMVTDDAGREVAGGAVDYYPYGLEIVPPGFARADASVRKYTGHERDEASGLDYMMARYKQVAAPHFASADPILIGANQHAYVNSNPVNYTDPTGYMSNPLCFDGDGDGKDDNDGGDCGGGAGGSFNPDTLPGHSGEMECVLGCTNTGAGWHCKWYCDTVVKEETEDPVDIEDLDGVDRLRAIAREWQKLSKQFQDCMSQCHSEDPLRTAAVAVSPLGLLNLKAPWGPRGLGDASRWTSVDMKWPWLPGADRYGGWYVRTVGTTEKFAGRLGTATLATSAFAIGYVAGGTLRCEARCSSR